MGNHGRVRFGWNRLQKITKYNEVLREEDGGLDVREGAGMKLTKSKRQWVLNKVNFYSDILGIEPPKVFLTMSDYNQWKADKRSKKGERVGRTECYGVCHKKDGFIVILPKSSPSLKHLDDTIRHELIHYTKSYNHCSSVFEDRMKRLKKGMVKNGRFI